MARKAVRPRARALQGDAAFLAEAVRLTPADVALLAGLEDYDGLAEDVRALLREAGQRQTIPLTLRVSERLAAALHGDGAVLYALNDPWALLNVLRLSVRSPRTRLQSRTGR